MRGRFERHITSKDMEIPDFMTDNISDENIDDLPIKEKINDQYHHKEDRYQSEERDLSIAEKKAWRNRIKAMTPQERAVTLSVYSIEEIFNELKRRIEESDRYVSAIKAAIGTCEDGLDD